MPDYRDPRSLQGRLARGNNIYNGGTMSAQSGGGPQFGRPRNKAPIPTPLSGKPSETQKPGPDLKSAIMRRLVGR